MTAGQWLKDAARRLENAGDADACTDARLFLCAVLECVPARLFSETERELGLAQLGRLEAMLARRTAGEPEQYIEGVSWFMGFEFKTDARALIPRQDTETVCECALEMIKHKRCASVLDIGTGSGCLAISIKKLRPDARVAASDISPAALALAAENSLKLDAQIETILSDGFGALEGRRFDLVVCNPPYLDERDMKNLQRELRYEPENALYGGADGLDFYRRFTADLPLHLNECGAVVFEVGSGQAEAVGQMLENAFPGCKADAKKDLNGIPRAVYMRIK
ncbi:MAG: peptide chain release factor N(5)-glutamine methyltransferase [Clostridia bacterium]|nr:peptide chain release factor N(5)-glutamine methyltransferase [Clostridia bacterium]